MTRLLLVGLAAVLISWSALEAYRARLRYSLSPDVIRSS